ncbi:MAG: amino acid permease [Kiritimatiellae bacterium]|nr:amino acid permease [Kiritimatiellia bacterium]
MKKPGGPRKLSVFTLMMINVAAVFSLRTLPGLAEYGYALIAYITLAALCFFIPSALVSAELASGWQGEGGVYLWVKEAFGPKWGFLAIFMQWVENLPWFPSVLAFAASALAYTFKPELAENKVFVLGVIWAALWLGTWLNFRGMKWSAFLSSSGVLVGTIIPGAVIIALGADRMASGDIPAIPFTAKSLLPDLHNLDQLMLLAAMLISFVGMEMSASHVNDVKNPARTYPRAIFGACALIIILSVFGSLAIALVIPPEHLSLSAGVCQAFDALFHLHNESWMTAPVCLLMAYGALTMVITWMAGPAKGMLAVAQEGYLPPRWERIDRNGMPSGIMITQAVLSSALSCVILIMPSVSSAFMLMSALAVQLYLVTYILLFAAVIRLRYTHPNVDRKYRIPGGKTGVWLVGGIALLTSLFVIIVGFIPPISVRREGPFAAAHYVLFLLAGLIVFTALPLLFYARAVRAKGRGALRRE